MSHDHNHDHDKNHNHDHTHSHDHSHSNHHHHSHGESEEMTIADKLEKLLTHWIDHNESHKDTFFTWAKRAKEAGIDQVAGKIEEVGKLSEKVTALLKEAEDELKK